jgi:hypothetical protein
MHASGEPATSEAGFWTFAETATKWLGSPEAAFASYELSLPELCQGATMTLLALGSVCTPGGGPGLQNQWRV